MKSFNLRAQEVLKEEQKEGQGRGASQTGRNAQRPKGACFAHRTGTTNKNSRRNLS